MMRRRFIGFSAVAALFGCRKPSRIPATNLWPAYPEKVRSDGVHVIDQYDVYQWQIQMRKILAQRIPQTGYSTCSSCGLPWWAVSAHNVMFSDHEGCFVVCELCFEQLGPRRALPFYEEHIRENYGEDKTKLERLRREIFKGEYMEVIRSEGE